MIVPLIHSEEFFERSRHPALSPPSRAFQKIPREGRSWEAGRALTPGLLGEQSPPFPTPRPVFSLDWDGGGRQEGNPGKKGLQEKGELEGGCGCQGNGIAGASGGCWGGKGEGCPS